MRVGEKSRCTPIPIKPYQSVQRLGTQGTYNHVLSLRLVIWQHPLLSGSMHFRVRTLTKLASCTNHSSLYLPSILADLAKSPAEGIGIPDNHFGWRKGTTTEHALHMLTEKIYSTWRQKRVCNLLCLDVSGAFDNHPRLLHNLRKRKVGSAIVNWVASFVSNRSTRIRVPDFLSRQF